MSSTADWRFAFVGLLWRLWPIGFSVFTQSLNAPQNPLAQSAADEVDSVDVAVVVLSVVVLDPPPPPPHPATRAAARPRGQREALRGSGPLEETLTDDFAFGRE
jgi:hypothetical protein